MGRGGDRGGGRSGDRRRRITMERQRQGWTVAEAERRGGRGGGGEGDPGRGGLQGTRPRAGQLGRPAPRGLSVCAG
eukprot:1196129-Prorocentrum_minimum.AAC.1